MSAPTARNASAPLIRRIGAQALLEARAVLSNGEQLLITLILPAGLLVLLTQTELVDLGGGARVDVVTPGVLAVAVMSTAFTSQAIATGFDRRAGVLRLLSVTPLGRGGLLAGKVLAVMVVEALQVAVLVAAAVGLGWRPPVAGAAAGLALILLGTAAFGALALLLAGVLRAEAVLAVANLVWLVLLVGGGVLLPADRLPGPLATTVRLLPSGALGEGLRAALGGEGPAVGPVLVLLVWAVAAGGAAVRLFRWS